MSGYPISFTPFVSRHGGLLSWEITREVEWDAPRTHYKGNVTGSNPVFPIALSYSSGMRFVLKTTSKRVRGSNPLLSVRVVTKEDNGVGSRPIVSHHRFESGTTHLLRVCAGAAERV